MRSSERTECIKSLIKLKQQQEVIERGLDNFLDSAKLGPDALRDLRNDERSCTSDRKKFANSVRMPAEEIANDLRSIKSIVCALQEGRNIDIESFKGKLVAVAEKIREFKKDPLFEKLSNEEVELDRDVREFLSTMHKYENRNCIKSATIFNSRESSRSKNSNATDYHDYSSVRDFDVLVAKTGHTQNWSEEDHLFFLKIRKTARCVPAMVAAIRKKCPDLSSERIVNHEAWYKVYLELRDKRRKIIKDWREKKEAEKKLKLDGTENETVSPNTEEKKSNRKDATKESEQIVSRSIGKSAIKKDSSGCDKKESLHQWRTDKENARSVEAEKTKVAIESQEALQERRRLSRATKIKSAVEAYREKKMENIMSSSTPSVTSSDQVVSKAEAARLMQCFRRQDEEFLNRRRALLQSRKSHTGLPVRSRVEACSDKKSTLMKPTKVWLEKCRVEESRVALPRQFLYVKDIPKLATCGWRNREST